MVLRGHHSMYTRRDFGRLAAVAGVSPALLRAKNDSKVNGVMIGAQSYSFRDMPEKGADAAIKGYTETGLSYAELWEGHVVPRGMKADEMKQWRTSPDALKQVKDIKAKFDNAGINIYAFNYSFRDN